MKKVILFSITLLSLTALVACGGWSQNPLKNANQMGPGQQDPTHKPKPDPIPNVIKIDAPDFQLFKEGSEESFQIGLRVLDPSNQYTTTLTLENLSDFAGATFDETTGKFTWKPAIGTATDDVSQFTLNLRATAVSAKTEAQVQVKSVTIGVVRTITQPTIVSVASHQYQLHEGDEDSFDVIVDDPSAGPTSADYPSLLILNDPQGANLAPFVSVGTPSKDTGTQFKFNVSVNLYNAELTKDRTTYAFQIVPLSHFQKSGQSQTISYDIETSLSNVTSTWTSPLTAAPGGKIDYQFLVIDPKGEGDVSLNSTTQIPDGATLDCLPYRSAVLNCRFNWDVPATQSNGDYSAEAEFDNKVPNSWDSYSVSTTLNFPITVVAPGSRK